MNQTIEQILPRSPAPGARRRRRVLLVSEAVTLAQIVRLAALGRSLDSERYEVGFAASTFPELIFSGLGFRQLPIFSLSAAHAADRVHRGRRLYDVSLLSRYVEDDRRVIAAFEPDLIVGDLRWSLSVSAPLSGVPHAALANAYWSPRAVDRALPLPEHPMVRALGPVVAGACFPIARPFVFRHFAEPLNRLRRRHGLSPIGSLQDVVTHGDHTLFADTPRLAPLTELRATEHYLGPVLWSPRGSLPPSWGQDPRRPPVYVTLGSSGDVDVLPALLHALDGLSVDVLVATAARYGGPRPRGVHFVDYVPGDLAARRAALVVTNGGSSTGYQALAEGTPVLGLPHNLDQYLAMKAIERVGAGRLVRSGAAQPAMLQAAISECLDSEALRRGAAEARADLESLDAAKRFGAFVESVTGAEAHRVAL